jgi:hypothetical protein
MIKAAWAQVRAPVRVTAEVLAGLVALGVVLAFGALALCLAFALASGR